MNRKQRRDKKNYLIAKQIIEMILKLDTKSLLELNKGISDELSKRSDLNDYIN